MRYLSDAQPCDVPAAMGDVHQLQRLQIPAVCSCPVCTAPCSHVPMRLQGASPGTGQKASTDAFPSLSKPFVSCWAQNRNHPSCCSQDPWGCGLSRTVDMGGIGWYQKQKHERVVTIMPSVLLPADCTGDHVDGAFLTHNLLHQPLLQWKLLPQLLLPFLYGDGVCAMGRAKKGPTKRQIIRTEDIPERTFGKGMGD